MKDTNTMKNLVDGAQRDREPTRDVKDEMEALESQRDEAVGLAEEAEAECRALKVENKELLKALSSEREEWRQERSRLESRVEDLRRTLIDAQSTRRHGMGPVG